MVNKIVLRESWDVYNGAGPDIGYQSRWTNTAGVRATLTAGRYGGQAIRFSSDVAYNHRLRRALDETILEQSGGMAIRFSNLLATERFEAHFLRMIDGSWNSQFRVGLASDGAVFLQTINAGQTAYVEVARSAYHVLSASVWHYLEWEALVHNTAGYVRIYLNGDPTPIINYTGKVGYNGGACTHVDIGPPTMDQITGNVDIDDIYIQNFAARLNPRRIQTIRVDGNGATQNWVPSTGTDHSLCVDEVLANTSDYVSGTNVGDTEQFTLSNLLTDPVTIDEVNLIVYAQKTDGGTRAIKIGVKSGAFIAESADIYLPNGFTRYEAPIPKDPDGNTAWLTAKVNALLAQVKVSV